VDKSASLKMHSVWIETYQYNASLRTYI